MKITSINSGINGRGPGASVGRNLLKSLYGSSMLRFATEIKVIDINPLIGKGDHIVAVDARITIEK